MSEPSSIAKNSDIPATSAEHFAVFLSHNSKDRLAVERIAEKLKRAGLEPWLDKWRLTPGGDWQNELATGLRASAACAVFVGPHGIGSWEELEYKLATDRMAKDRAFRLFLVLLPGLPEPFDASQLPPFLSLRGWVDLRRGLDDTRAFQSLVNAIKGLPLGPERAIEPRDDACPYRGLQTFDEAHAEFFFGRDSDTQRLVEKLKGTRFLAVLGPSGSGKSSLVRAGLIPALRRGQLQDSDRWPIQVFTPTAHPLTQLAANLLRLHPQGAMGQTLDQMLSDERTLHLAVALAMAERPAGERAALVVDQFEEVFTLCRDERERAQFLANLLYAAFIPDGRCVLLLALRADFYPKCAAYPELSARLAKHQFLVSPMDSGGLRQAIEEPAWRVGLEFESGLSETILKDVQSQPGALPLLEHALLELWERRRGGLLTLEAYRESGGVEGAIAQRADAIFKTFTPEQQAIVRRVMLRLTQPGRGTEDTRRRATMDELVTQPGEVVEKLVKEMVDASLLTTSVDEETGERVVEVSHETLIHGWPKLREWLDEDRAGLLIHRRLTEAVQEWRRLGKNDSVLYRGPVLGYAMEWRRSNEEVLNNVEKEFLDESVARQAKEQRSAKRRGWITDLSPLAAALVIAGVAWMLFGKYTQSNSRLRESQISLEIAKEELADALATVDTQDHAFPHLYATLRGHSKKVNSAYFSPDGKKIVTASDDGTAMVWRELRDSSRTAETGSETSQSPTEGASSGPTLPQEFSKRRYEKVYTLEMNYGPYYQIAAFTPDGEYVVTIEKRRLMKWDVFSKRAPQPVVTEILIEPEGIVAFSRDGKYVVRERFFVGIAKTPHSLNVWDSNTNNFLCALVDDNPTSAAFSPNGKYIATIGSDNVVRMWEVCGNRKIVEFATGVAKSIAFSPDGNRLVTTGEKNTVDIWDASTGHHLIRLLSHTGNINSATYSPNGRLIVTANANGTAQIWDAINGRSLLELRGHTDSMSGASFNPDGKLIVTASADKTVRVWKVPDSFQDITHGHRENSRTY